MYVVIWMVFSSDAGSTPAISTVGGAAPAAAPFHFIATTMPYHLKFTKVTGAGNDFVLIDDRGLVMPLDPSALARILCSPPPRGRRRRDPVSPAQFEGRFHDGVLEC